MQEAQTSIPFVSHAPLGLAYRVHVDKKKEKTPFGWGARFREYAKKRGLSLGKVAERLEVAESTVRSWTNGTRDINLTDFVRLCDESGLDHAMILFSDKVDAKFLAIGEAWTKATPEQRGVLWTAAQGILAQHESNRKRGAGAG